jgi:hypothetical protein
MVNKKIGKPKKRKYNRVRSRKLEKKLQNKEAGAARAPQKNRSLKGRLTRHKDKAHDRMIDAISGALITEPPRPGMTEDDLKIKDIERKKFLLNSDPKFKMIFRFIADLPYVNIPMKSYEESIKLYDKWSESGKAEDIPSETDFYNYRNNSQKLSHLEWTYNEYMSQMEESSEEEK